LLVWKRIHWPSETNKLDHYNVAAFCTWGEMGTTYLGRKRSSLEKGKISGPWRKFASVA